MSRRARHLRFEGQNRKEAYRWIETILVKQLYHSLGNKDRGPINGVLTNDEQYVGYASVGSLQVGGPYSPLRTTPDTPSRREIFVCQPQTVAEEAGCANKILVRVARRAFRRPVTEEDIRTLSSFFAQGRKDRGSFDAGIQFALERLLVDPDFLLRVLRDPPQARPGQPYPLTDLELASRLSFFLWSSIPDEALLSLAEQHKLSDPQTLDQQVRRMLVNTRAESLVTNFAAQWLKTRLDCPCDPQRSEGLLCP